MANSKKKDVNFYRRVPRKYKNIIEKSVIRYSEEADQYDNHRFISEKGKFFHEIDMEAFFSILGDISGKRILDVAAGTGRLSLELAKKGAQVIALDVTYDMLLEAKKKFSPGMNIFFCNADGRKLPFKDNSFDVITCIRFTHLVSKEDMIDFISEMKRVLKPGGYVIIQFGNKTREIFIGFLEEFLHSVIKKEYKRTTYYPKDYRYLFKDMKIVRKIGIGFTGLELVARLSKSLAMNINLIGRIFPFMYLTKKIIIQAYKNDH